MSYHLHFHAVNPHAAVDHLYHSTTHAPGEIIAKLITALEHCPQDEPVEVVATGHLHDDTRHRGASWGEFKVTPFRLMQETGRRHVVGRHYVNRAPDPVPPPDPEEASGLGSATTAAAPADLAASQDAAIEPPPA
jgi:hypothetical protein